MTGPSPALRAPTPTAQFLSASAKDPRWNAAFGRPIAARSAFRLEGVRTVVDFAAAAARRGKWAALVLAYESASAFDPALPSRPSKFPLAWAAWFDEPIQPPVPRQNWAHGRWKPALTSGLYGQAVRRIKKRIAGGETYQANFTFPLETRWRGSAWAWFHDLARRQGAPYSAYLDLGRWKILSLSPELFFEKRGRALRVRPMKGSAPRGATPALDAALARRLARDPKERAENLMVVDMLRNDLGKVATGVRATRLFDVESYPTVHQMTSTVEGRSRAPLWEILRALFPSGSVTGAPKRRTMEILQLLEKAPRGLYTGAIGLLQPNGGAVFNVAIRTLTLEGTAARCPVGSGVTWPSDPRREYEECLLKGEFLKPPTFSLLESLRLEDGRWFLKEEHLARLAASAARFKFGFSREAVEKALGFCARGHALGLWKVRLTVSPGGKPQTTAIPLEPPRPWRVALAKKPMAEDDIFLYHKTTQRRAYESARRSRPGFDDVILFNRRGEITESTMANVVVLQGNNWYTPPLNPGLNGVFRAELLRAGRLKGKVLRPSDLRAADAVYLVNSVRRWIPIVGKARL